MQIRSWWQLAGYLVYQDLGNQFRVADYSDMSVITRISTAVQRGIVDDIFPELLVNVNRNTALKKHRTLRLAYAVDDSVR